MTVAEVESLDREGRGVAHLGGKALFLEGALPGERVAFEVTRRKPSYETGRVEVVLRANAARVEPRCPHFGVCGGCSLQHLEPQAQVAAKQRVLEDCLWHIARVRAQALLSPIQGEPWHYRRRARLSVRRVAKKGGVLVGFHERRSSFVADMNTCPVLPRSVSDAIPGLRGLVEGLSIRERLPQIEVAAGDEGLALVLRVLAPPSTQDLQALRRYADSTGFQLWLQPAGPDSAQALRPADTPWPAYSLPEFAVSIRFLPTDFTQVNQGVNRMLVRRVMALLDPRPGEPIVDYFCGLGNFSLPATRCGASVLGVEGNAGLARRAAGNARSNGLEHLCRFEVANLFDPGECMRLPSARKVILDPPREGAIELVKSLEGRPVERIVYVSCDPATLARDAAVLVNAQGYRLTAACAANMFPHTSHVESLALFERRA